MEWIIYVNDYSIRNIKPNIGKSWTSKWSIAEMLENGVFYRIFVNKNSKKCGENLQKNRTLNVCKEIYLLNEQNLKICKKQCVLNVLSDKSTDRATKRKKSTYLVSKFKSKSHVLRNIIQILVLLNFVTSSMCDDIISDMKMDMTMMASPVVTQPQTNGNNFPFCKYILLKE